jgi:hypothetical protein
LDLAGLLPHIATTAISIIGAAVSTAFVVGRRLGEAQEREKQRDKLIEDLKQGWRLELSSFREDVEEHIRKDEVMFEKFRDRQATAAQEANEQWNKMERTLGQIEGTLKRSLRLPR